MVYNSAPESFFGNDYALASNAISLNTSEASNTSIGTFTSPGDSADATLTVSTAHNLKVGDIVTLTTTGTLPAGLATGTEYFVVAVTSTTEVELSATRGGTAIVPTDAGTGTHTLTAKPSLQELTNADANASTGDWRAVLFALLELFWQKYNNTPSADRPSRVQAIRTTTSDDVNGTITRNYTFSITLSQDDVSVAAE